MTFLQTVSQFHENPKLVAWVQSFRLIHVLTSQRRRSLLSWGSIGFGVYLLLKKGNEGELWKASMESSKIFSVFVALLILLTLLYLLFLAAKHREKLPGVVSRHPQISLHAMFWSFFVLMWVAPSSEGPWKTVLLLVGMTISFFIWRCGYLLLLIRRGKIDQTTFRDHLFYLLPAWNGSHVPYGKGLDYLSQCEAHTAEAYARSVLAGVKLLILSLLWLAVLHMMNGMVYGDPHSWFLSLFPEWSFKVPRLEKILAGVAPASQPTAWVSLYLDLVRITLKVAHKGHLWIGLLRLAGFNVFRNTYRPLLAESIVDFWNRFQYYFKELLTEFFFFPTYLRYFRSNPHLRMFVAVFMAVFVGNMYFHFLIKTDDLIAMDFANIWHLLSPRLVYCFFLTIGIYASLLHQQKKRGTPNRPGASPWVAWLLKFQRIAVVWTFYSMIHIWNLSSKHIEFQGRSDFFLSLFGLS